MSDSLTIAAQKRPQVGSRHARRLRREGRIPCSIQAHADDPHLDVHVDEAEFLAARRHHVHLFDLDVEGTIATALIRELAWNSMGDRIVHVEFRRVIRGQKTEVEVELEFIGHPKGGVLNHLVTHVPVKALPTAIPDSIEVRVDELEIGHPILAGDLVLPEGVELDMDPETQVAVVSVVRAIEEGAPAEGEVPEGEAPAAEGEAESKGDEALRRVEILRLRFQDGLPIREIAVHLGMDPAKVHHDYATARAEFRKALEQIVAFHSSGSPALVEKECERLLTVLS